uniref:FBA_2 domain-containing protein n=1 Tax=Panagrellus redivivus TaxID=6233 RepID=A0A7E4VM73_PANRE
MLYFRIDVNAVNTKLLSLIVPTYQFVSFAEDGYTIEEMVKFFHPKLTIWHICDSALLQTREKWIKYWVTMFTFIRSRKNATISLLRCPAGLPIYYNKIKGGIARFCPTYRVDIKDDYVIIERKRKHYLNP